MPSIISSFITRLRRNHAHNLTTFRQQPLSEISGSLGDLGTFLPLLIALTTNHAISLSTTLILTGIYNIATGIFFGIPLPVQPMKAIAAVAILKRMSAGEVAAAGLFVGSVIGFLSVTRLLSVVTRYVPVPVVKGIQVGAGLSLVVAAGTTATASLSWTGPTWADNKIWLIVTFIALLTININISPTQQSSSSRIPFALLTTTLGIIFALTLTLQTKNFLPHITPWHPKLLLPTTPEWRIGILTAGIGQLPLTTLNSIIAVTHLSADLLPHISTPSVTSIGLSITAMNLISCFFSGMPVCHGSGGLAAQYKFGARSGASIIFLGVLKLILGLVFGNSLTALLQKFPSALLSVLVIAAGLELVSVGESLNTVGQARDLKETTTTDTPSSTGGITQQERKERWTTMMVTAGLLLAFKNDAVGFLAGMACHYSFVVGRRSGNSESEGENEHERRPLLS